MASPPTTSTAASSSTTKPVFALDFDGVSCDSVGESAASAWVASERMWPALFDDPAVQAKKAGVLASMRTARPVIETGYENLVQVRCLVEGVRAEEMLADWPGMLAARMADWKLDRADVSSKKGEMMREGGGGAGPERALPRTHTPLSFPPSL